MEIAEILQHLERESGAFPLVAVEAAIARRDEIIPQLLRILEDTIERAEELGQQDGYMAHLYAMYLLAQFHQTRAYPLVIRLALLPDDILDPLCGDFSTDGIVKVLASVCGGDVGPIQSLAESDEADGYVRWSALSSLVTLVAVGQKTREEIIEYFAQLFRGKLTREWSPVWEGLVSCSYDLCAVELFDDIQQAIEDELVNGGVMDMDDIKRRAASGTSAVLASLAEDPHAHLVNNVVDEMAWWRCFQRDDEAAATVRPVREYVPAPSWEPPLTIRNEKPKTGRNDPCPCGSGKKYKKCCGG